MFPGRWKVRCLTLPLAVMVGLGAAVGQEHQDPKDPATEIAEAAEAWVASDQSSTELLDKTVKVLLAHQEIGIAWVARELPAAQLDRIKSRSKAVLALATHVPLEFLEQVSKSGVFFAGQFDPLLPLQPFVGDLFFMLLLETPNWFPETHRIRLVPALRDLQPGPPSDARLDGVIALVDNVAIEPEPLRTALAGALWQWGRKQYAQAILDRLRAASTEGDLDDRVRTMLDLADLQYRLRDYAASAATHRQLEAMAENAHYRLKPVEFYSAACVWSLSGKLERAFEALEKCAALQLDPDIDSSHKLERRLFEKDPEIAPLRRDPRFAALFAKLFPKPETEAGGR